MADENKSPVDKSPVDQLLDLFVYAPLGLALTARDQLPQLIERGRKQVTQQTTLAKMMGQYAVKEGEKEIRKRVDRMTQPPAPSRPAADTTAAKTQRTAASPTAGNGKASIAEDAPAPEPKPSGDHLAIPGYDALSASQVVQRLPGLSGEELAAVRAYEEATRGRRTILTKIGQLQSESS